MEQEHQTGSSLDLVRIFDGGVDLSKAGIITATPNIGLPWDSIQSDRLLSRRGTMAQHFLLSAQARTLSLKAIYQAGDDEAYDTFCKLRWPETDGSPRCPRCECTKAYSLCTRRKFKCAACHHQFSVTSGTIFACRKLSFVDLLAAICLFVNAAKGASALQLSRDFDVQYKTAFVLAHKLREALAAETAQLRLSNTVEVDGAYFGGHVRQANLKVDRVDRRLLQNRTDKRRVVVALRERSGRTLAVPFAWNPMALPSHENASSRAA